MIEGKIAHGAHGVCSIRIEGSLGDIKEDTLSLVKAVYEAILEYEKAENREADAESYKKFVCEELNNRWDDAKPVTDPTEALKVLLEKLEELLCE